MGIRKSLAIAAGMSIALAGLAACGAEREESPTDTTETATAAEAGGLIGITMPTVSLERWNNDGAQLKEELEALGYETSLEYADNKNELQIQQIENQINDGAKVLVIASIDGSALGPTVAKAKEAGAVVIGYDRLLLETSDIDYYATFDNYKVGQLQGEYIKEQLKLDTEAGPFNLEPFAGSPDDNNAGLFFEGAWDVLKPYVDEGKLVIQSESGKKAMSNWQDIGILEWKSATAQSEMENRLNAFYQDKKVDVVLSPNDSLALGIAQALEGAGYVVGTDWPVLTGQDGDVANVQNILDGKQSMTVWKDTRELAAQVAVMVDQVVTGGDVDVNTAYDNGTTQVPAYHLEPKVVTADTVESDLVGSGFITADKLTFP
jgi:putative multiple sugar transport system substrate-binding protein